VGGAIRYSVWESPVGILESGTGALALTAAAIALVASFQPAIMALLVLATDWLWKRGLACALDAFLPNGSRSQGES
jgi:hypothetical protein